MSKTASTVVSVLCFCGFVIDVVRLIGGGVDTIFGSQVALFVWTAGFLFSALLFWPSHD